MLLGIALILIGIYAVLPKAIAITLIVFGAVSIFTDSVVFICKRN